MLGFDDAIFLVRFWFLLCGYDIKTNSFHKTSVRLFLQRPEVKFKIPVNICVKNITKKILIDMSYASSALGGNTYS